MPCFSILIGIFIRNSKSRLRENVFGEARFTCLAPQGNKLNNFPLRAFLEFPYIFEFLTKTYRLSIIFTKAYVLCYTEA